MCICKLCIFISSLCAFETAFSVKSQESKQNLSLHLTYTISIIIIKAREVVVAGDLTLPFLEVMLTTRITTNTSTKEHSTDNMFKEEEEDASMEDGRLGVTATPIFTRPI